MTYLIDRVVAERTVWDRAERILAERHSRGDIGDDEYARRLSTLRSGRGGPPAGAA